jgi:hypothetical protein
VVSGIFHGRFNAMLNLHGALIKVIPDAESFYFRRLANINPYGSQSGLTERIPIF